MSDLYHKWNASFKPLIIGLVLSIALILVAYWIAIEEPSSGGTLQYIIIGLCTVQALIQLIYFLHLGIEPHPRWNLITFLFTVVVTIIVVGGSLWIMSNLKYNVVLP